MADELHIDGWARTGERPLLRRLDDIALQVESRYAAQVTDFLTPREQFLAQSIGRYHHLNTTFWGGYSQAERKRALLAPEYWDEQESDYNLCVLTTRFPERNSVTHRHIMGSLLGTGIQRKKVGDIGLQDNQAYVVVAADLADFIRAQWRLPDAANSVVECIEHVEDFPVSEYQSVSGTVSSLRLDAVIAQFCKFSRGKAQEAVKKGRITLNFADVTDPAVPLEPGDIISVRGFGRIKLESLGGQSKRGKQRIEVGVLKS